MKAVFYLSGALAIVAPSTHAGARTGGLAPQSPESAARQKQRMENAADAMGIYTPEAAKIDKYLQ